MQGIDVSRRGFLGGALAAGMTFGGRTARAVTGGADHETRCISKEVFIPSREGTGVFPGFITYIHAEKPVLLHRFGWVDASDTYDDFRERISEDNGKTWSEPVPRLASKAVDGGRVRYAENGAFYDADTSTLITVVSKLFYPGDKFDQDQPRQLEVNVYDPMSDSIPPATTHDFGLPGGIGCSFCFPIKTKDKRIVIPCFKAQLDEAGTFIHHPESDLVTYEARMLLGEYDAAGAISWRLGNPIIADNARNSRGFSESSPVELRDGRLALLLRGSNAGMPERPGYKWLCLSEDGGDSWNTPAPMAGDDGAPIESSATGCALFRSIHTGKVYFMGNLCMPGEHADGNWPRSPLYIAEVQEDPFVILRETIAVIDERGADDGEKTQISNFRYYQDRETPEVAVFATRFGEHADAAWKQADHYRYRVAIA